MKYCFRTNHKLRWLAILTLFFFPFIHSKIIESGKNEDELISKLHIGSTSNAYTQPMNIHPIKAKAVPTVHNAISGSEATLQRKKGNLNLFETDLSNIVLLSDIDGGLHAIDRYTGERFWSIFDEECEYHSHNDTRVCPGLVDVQESKINDDDSEDYHFSETLIIEPYGEGSLYFFNLFTGLHKIPATIKQLVDQSPIQLKTQVAVDSKGTLLEDEKIYTGHKKSVIYSIDALTGEVLAVYGDNAEKSRINFQRLTNTKNTADVKSSTSSSTVATAPHPSDDCNSNKTNSNGKTGRNVKPLTIGRTTYTLEIHSPLQNTKFNISYTTWQHNSLDNALIPKYGWPTDNSLVIPVTRDDGLVAGLDLGENLDDGRNDQQRIKWITGGMNSMKSGEIVNVFDIFEEESNHLHQGESFILPHPFMAHDYGKRVHEYNTLPNSVYLSKTKAGSWFALSRYNYPALVDAAPASIYQTKNYGDKSSFFNSKDMKGVHFIADELSNKYYEDRNKYEYQKKLHTKHHSVKKLNRNSKHLPVLYTNNQYMLDKYKQNQYGHEEDISVDSYFPYMEDLDRVNYFDGHPDVFHGPPPRMFPDVWNRFGPPRKPFLRLKPMTFTEEVTRGFLHMIEWSIFKIFETVLFVVLIVLIVFFVTKIKLGTNFKVLVEKSGFRFSFEQENLRLIESTTAVLATDTNMNDINNVSSIGNESDNDEVDTLHEFELKKPQYIDASVGSQKKKRKRGKRSGTKSKIKQKDVASQTEVFSTIHDHSYDEEHTENVNTSGQTIVSSLESADKKLFNITLSNKILGYGSAGTVVYQGSFQNRSVAVKRLLLEFYDIASQEIKLLTMSDDHPNVVRYYCSEVTDKFLYIALELCSTSLDCVIEKNKAYSSRKIEEICENFDTLDCLKQITSGVDYLHSLKIVHRDLKPQNILVSMTSKNKVRIIISDFGVCKKLETEESSFMATNRGGPVGTQGWRAPELLLLKSSGFLSNNNSLEDLALDNSSGLENTNDDSSKDSEEKNRLTRAVDIFSLGCVFYYVLSGGKHPFGKSYIRENNIIKNEYDLTEMKMDPTMKHYEIEAQALIADMINTNASLRPTASNILKYPLFWDILKNLDFLLKVSDRMEVERRDPPSPLLLKFNAISPKIISNGDWMKNFDTIYIENLGKYRKYQKDKIIDLLRTFRNKYHHFMDLQDDLKLLFSPFPDGFFTYYIRRFPSLIIEIYNFVEDNLKDDQILKDFF